MAIKLVDELKAMGNFPIAHAEGINLVKTDGTEDNLQNLFDNGELGGGDSSVTLTQEGYEALSEEQKLDGLYYTCDTKRIYKNGVQYGASDAEDIGYNNAESGIQATTVQGAIDTVNSNLDEKVDYKVVVEDGTRYVEDIVTQDINTWLPNDNSSILINLKKTNGINYLNFQLLCNKKDSKNWSCIVNGAANELWKIRYVNGVRYIDEIATMDKAESKYEEATLDTPTDWNTLNTEARYYFSGGTPMTNSPEEVPFGLLEVINVGLYCRIQRYFAFNGKLYIRRWSGNSWNEWYRFDGISI